MLRRIELINFKCFASLGLSLAPLTVLAGMNGAGKSSVIQSMLVLRQSAEGGSLEGGSLILRGRLVSLGTGRDVLFEDALNEIVGFKLYAREMDSALGLQYIRQGSDALNLWRPQRLARNQAWRSWKAALPFSGELLYVNAERIGPRVLYDQSEDVARRNDLGIRGEHTLNYLHANRDKALVEDDPRSERRPRRRLLDVLDHWLQAVSPGVHMNLDPVQNADALMTSFSFDRQGDIPTRPFRATNVGFGISYILPVLAALLAPAGTLCLIENPEAHLHPRGQTKIAELAVRAAIAGVQIIVETHSDHFLDGVRIAVRDGLIEPGQTAIHYFAREGNAANVISPEIDVDGRLSEWPEGFFDQYEENLMKLLAPRS